ncbi:flippase [Candidatus Woesearchaeota archaeon]|nr:flippase [Candidatus Woesearchaeota archaeon]
MSTAKIIAKNTGYLFTAEIINKILSFILIILITRYLGDVGYGKYAFAFAFIGLFVVFSHAGIMAYLLREISRHKDRAKQLIGNALGLRAALILGTYAAAAALGYLWPKTQEILWVIFLVMAHELISQMHLMLGVVFKAFERNEFTVSTMAVDRITALVFGAAALAWGYGILGLLAGLILGKIITLLFSGFLCWKFFFRPAISADIQLWKSMAMHSLPFWAARVFEVMYQQTDKVMLTWLKSYQATGWFSAGSALVSGISFIPVAVINATVPAMSRFHHFNAKKELMKLYEKSFYYMVAASAPISVGTFLLAQRFILFFYKHQFTESGIVLQILSLSFIFLFVNFILGYLLSSINQQQAFTKAIIVSSIANVILNLALIPPLSYLGSAFATVISQALSFILLYLSAQKHGYRLDLIRLSYKPILSAAIMGIAIVRLDFLPIAVLVPLAVLVYGIALASLGGIHKEERELLKSFFPR